MATGSDGLTWRIVVTDPDALVAGLFEPEQPMGVVPLFCDSCMRVVGVQNVGEAAMRYRTRVRYECRECRVDGVEATQ